jgi:predicted ATPase/DNA-binding SARP family transcriptional activator
MMRRVTLHGLCKLRSGAWEFRDLPRKGVPTVASGAGVNETTQRAVRISTLGGFVVSIDGVVVDRQWRLRKAKTLVKVLALAPNHRAHRDVLGEQLWPNLDQAAIANNLHQALHSARTVLGQDRVVLRDDVVILGPNDDVIVDVDEFAAAAGTAISSGGLDELRRVHEMWRGDLLPEDLYEDWAAARREHVAGLRVAVAVKLAEALVERGAASHGVAILEPLGLERPSDESVNRSLMSALVAAGRRWDGAGVYERLRLRLDEEFGLPPEQETIDLFRRLFVGGAAQPKVPNNLPLFSASFVGRQAVLRDLNSALERTRLLTLTGPGGSGKTRLAIELAYSRAATGRECDGVWLVELAGVGRGGPVESAVASALGLALRRERGAPSALADQLAGRRIMLVIDNCEHVLTNVLPLTAELLKRCADVLIVATSREPLEVPGELAWRVPSLELPPAGFNTPEVLARLESVQLFVERARGVAPSFALDETNAAPIAEICRRLDGIPLALELAAARVAHVSIWELHDRLNDVLAFLRRSSGRHLDRQQTMAATLDWSQDLLADDERTVFRRLAVFAGGFNLDAAAYVCNVGEVVDPLGRLVDKSLVVADTTSGVAARYRLLEVIRQYALGHLDEAQETRACRDRHRDWYTREAEAHDPDRDKPIAIEPSPWFDTERDNLRAALSTAIEHDPSAALRLAASTWRFFMSRGQIAEGSRWLTSALDACSDVSATRARALFALGVFSVRRAEQEAVLAIGQQIVEVCEATGDDEAVALALDQQAIFTLMGMGRDWATAVGQSAASVARCERSPEVHACAGQFDGVTALMVGDASAAGKAYAAALRAVARVPPKSAPFLTVLSPSWTLESGPVPLPTAEDTMLLGRRVGAEQARGYLTAGAAIADRLGGLGERALLRLLEAESCFRRLGDDYGLAYTLNQRAQTLRSLRSLDAAIATFETALKLRRALLDERAIAISMSGRSFAQALRGEAHAARSEVREALTMMERSGDTVGLSLIANNATITELLLGNHAEATSHLERAIEIFERLPQHFSGWQYLLLAHLRLVATDRSGSAAAARIAHQRFGDFGDERGMAALQSACKAGRVMLDASPPA